MLIVSARGVGLVPILALICAATGAPAQDARPAPTVPMAMTQAPCPSTPTLLPPEFAGWSRKTPIKAALTAADLSAAMIVPDHGALVVLSPEETVRYPVVPGHHGEPGTTGGLLEFSIAETGTYRVALGAGAWIDVVHDRHALASVAHGHGPACGPIRKTVAFTLTPGKYVLQVSGHGGLTLALMIAALPR